ncbi:PBP superfamily domain protein [Caprobacter fermentans]|uniref:PBP superfamily domain protein n=1 Tax=Caproicibacter fermentans TaxID=2576756 RepID=A0A6N8HXW0_9FIRM|nr:helix-turn-helix transcriptional regulator [Caproicibacter fermentans]MVB10694.1 PBP superfamily domain protein [Caproicibacter fermentans]
MNQPAKELTALTPQEVADLLKISKNLVYELIKRKELNGYRIGNKIRFDYSDIRAYLESAKTGPGKADKNAGRNPLLSEREPVENGFVLCGQDLALDLLSRRLEEFREGQRILRSYIGSYNGLYGLYNNEVQLATAHLWDGKTGTYNTTYLRSLLPGTAVVSVNLAYRMQGFYVQKGNPKNLCSWEDLKRSDITIANREKGSGTRILLDEHLRLLGLEGTQIKGYNRACLTHLAAAGAVARGGADAAVGIEKTAMQVDSIEFVPLQKERYDLVFKKENLSKPLFRQTLETVRSPEFRAELQAIGGYDVSETGMLTSG